MAQKGLSAAKTAKKDEFYTQMIDIERELQHYWPHFRGKVIFGRTSEERLSSATVTILMRATSLSISLSTSIIWG